MVSGVGKWVMLVPRRHRLPLFVLLRNGTEREVLVSDHWFAVHGSLAGNSKWEPGADILTGGGDDKK